MPEKKRADGSRTAKRHRLAAALGLTVLGTVLVWTPSANAQEGFPLTVAPGTAAPGEVVTVEGDSCFGGDAIVQVGDWDPVGTSGIFVSPGSWALEVPVPVDADPGTYVVKAVCDHYGRQDQYADTQLTVSGPPSQQQTVATIQIGSTTVVAGTGVQVNGTGFLPGEDVTVTIFSDPVLLDTVQADDAGEVAAMATIPVDTPPGEHTIVLHGETSGREASTSVTITSAQMAPGATGGTLARTGSGMGAIFVLGAVSVLLGLVLLTGSGRFRRYVGCT